MNILFLLKSFDIGGLEVVTTVLANKFYAEGHHVVLWAFYEGDTSLRDRLNNNIPIIYGHGFMASSDNVTSLRKALIENSISIVVNQWGLPLVPARTLKKASKGLDIKVIAVYHNDPSTNGRLKGVEIAMDRTQSLSKKLLLSMKHWCFKQITAASMRYIYRNSDRFMVLSASFIDGFRKFTGLKNTEKLIVQTNPITIDTPNYVPDLDKKNKEIIYVGRVDYNQKRVSRIIEVWSLLEHKHPDWKLLIVGDGPEKTNLENLSRQLGLSSVSFEGFKNPMEYYERASILVLASEYEGFGLVIVEAMSFGVVPVVLGSYSAVFDILNDGENGFILPYRQNEGFHAQEMADIIEDLMENPSKLKRMGMSALDSSIRYSINNISEDWNGVFRHFWGGNFSNTK